MQASSAPTLQQQPFTGNVQLTQVSPVLQLLAFVDKSILDLIFFPFTFEILVHCRVIACDQSIDAHYVGNLMFLYQVQAP